MCLFGFDRFFVRIEIASRVAIIILVMVCSVSHAAEQRREANPAAAGMMEAWESISNKLSQVPSAQVRRDAQAGDAMAQNQLGWLYESGQGVAKDRTQAVAWIRKAADQNYGPAVMSMGWL